MIVLTIFSLLLILFASYLQYNAQSEDYNLRRLFRKETQVKTHLNYLMKRDSAFQKISEKKSLYQQEFASIAAIHRRQRQRIANRGRASAATGVLYRRQPLTAQRVVPSRRTSDTGTALISAPK